MKLFKKNQIQIILQVAISLVLFHFVFFRQQLEHNRAFLSDFNFALYLLSFILIGVGGLLLYKLIIHEEKPQMELIKNPDRAYYLYLFINIFGVALGFHVANAIDKPSFAVYFIMEAALLYIFITQWRKKLIFANIAFALALVIPILGVGFFDIFPLFEQPDFYVYKLLFELVLDFGILMFLLFIVQSFIQDILHRPEDFREGKRTIAVKWGSKVALKVTALLVLLPFVAVIYYSIRYLSALNIMLIYTLVCLAGPLLYCAVELWLCKSRNAIKRINIVMNLVVWFSVLSLVLLTYNLNLYAHP